MAQVREREPVLRAFVDQAIELAKAGRQVDFKERRELQLPDELRDRLDSDPDLAAAFAALTPGRRRSHVLHVSGAKQSKTRAARVERCAERILQGKGFNERPGR